MPRTLRVIDEPGYKEPTPVRQSHPPILEGRDMVGSAQTGTENRSCLPTLQRLKPGNAALAWPRLANWPSRSKKLSHLRKHLAQYGPFYGGEKYGKQLEQLQQA